MKKTILILSILTVSTFIFAQDKKMQKIKDAYAESDFEKCIKSSENYIDDNNKNPEPYYYIAFSNFQQYKASTGIIKKKLIQKTISKTSTGIHKDNDKKIFNQYPTKFAEIHDTLINIGETLYDAEKFDESEYYFKYLVEIFNDTTEQYKELFIPKPKSDEQSLAFRNYNGLTNQLDKAGKKTGLWIKKYESGFIEYEIEFKNDNPVGIYRKYYKNGKLKANMYFYENGKQVSAILYNENGSRVAQGYYWEQQKDSLWQYFVNDSIVIREENYTKGLKNGYQGITNFNLYPLPIDVKYYKNGLQDSIWIRNYPSGKKKFFCYYKNGKREGPFNQFYEDQKVKITGRYSKGIRTGTWKFWNEEKNKYNIVEYKNGVRVNDEHLSEEESKRIQEMSEKALEEINQDNFFNNQPEY